MSSVTFQYTIEEAKQFIANTLSQNLPIKYEVKDIQVDIITPLRDQKPEPFDLNRACPLNVIVFLRRGNLIAAYKAVQEETGWSGTDCTNYLQYVTQLFC